MSNKRSIISGIALAVSLAGANIVVGASSASALSGYISGSTCSSITVGWSAETTDEPGYFTLTAVASSGETTQFQRTLVAPGNGMTDQAISLPDLSGTGPWEIRLTWDAGDRDYQLLDTVAVSSCDDGTPSDLEQAEQALADAQEALAAAKQTFKAADSRAEKKAALADVKAANAAVRDAKKAVSALR